MNKILMPAAAIALSLFATVALAATAPTKIGDSAKGKVLTNTKGMTLYTFAKDTTPNESMCKGGCLKNWPAVKASADAHEMGDWTVISREDGTKQWAYKGKPLYYFANDKKEGDTVGEGKGNGAWHIAKP